MAAVPEPEVQFAQRLASNEKPTRTKAMKKLRKYINVRSGGFTGDELLKLWKGLFYCLWMQDKPLLQEELSRQISSLIHSFQDVDGQVLYLESFLQTFKREWTGIDRLRMDKFFQLVRFMFRQTFEMLKRKNWESSVVGRFLELLTVQLLQSGSDAPSGLQLHILDLYMTELAAVGSAELTADQNLTFIQPFCKTAARTKDRTLFRAICNSIFSTIIDQAPFAIEDLMEELKGAEASDSDSGQASEEEEDEKMTSKPGDKKRTRKQINGKKPKEEDDEDDEDEDDDDLLHLEDSDTEAPCDEDVGPVLQFDYAALANKLFELASRSNTPSQNRQRLYKIIKVLRDLSEGVFPQDEYPEDVSTDEDDEMFGSRKRMKKRGRHMEVDEEGAPATKKSKGKKKEASTLNQQEKDPAKDDDEPADLTTNNEKKKKKRKKKKKKNEGQGGEKAEGSEQEQVVDDGSQKDAPMQSSISSVKVTEAGSETVIVSEVRKQPSVKVTEETSQQAPGTNDDNEPSEKSSDADVTTSGKKKKKKKKKKLQTDGIVAESQVEEESSETNMTPEADTTTPAKKTKNNGVSTEDDGSTTAKKSKKKNLKAVEADAKQTDPEITSACEDATADATEMSFTKKTKKKTKQEDATLEAPDESAATPLKKKKRKNNKGSTVEEEGEAAVEETPQVADAEKLLVTMTTPAKKKKAPAAAQVDEIKDQTQVEVVGGEDAELPPDNVLTSSGKLAKKKKRKIPVVFEFEADEVEAAAAFNGVAEEETMVKKTKLATDAGEPSIPLSAKKSQKKAKASFISFKSKAAVPTPLFCKTKGGLSMPRSGKKKSQTPKSESKKVTFGLKNNKTAEFRKTDRSLLVSPDGSSRVPFDPKQKPKFGVLKSPATPLSSKKTPNGTRKAGAGTPKRRPSAADFF
ncbi:Ribosomal RNA processing protein 1-like protein A [Larimichthys crocea]|uniref:Ribosomal RNA processing protein 1-like protein A n=1 Tax=Larimichthys crocea TaxID=215358 RepID=A0A6G0J5G9_LARCR|nr:Ribosomal RNA processing protein 1-like protein A [Larimichthys crocea]